MNVTINQEENNYHVILEGRIDTTNADQSLDLAGQKQSAVVRSFNFARYYNGARKK